MLKSVVNTRPDEIEEGDVFAVTVTLHVGFMRDGKPMVRAYRCPYPNAEIGEGGVPQGDNIYDQNLINAMIKSLVPVLGWAEAEPDPTL